MWVSFIGNGYIFFFPDLIWGFVADSSVESLGIVKMIVPGNGPIGLMDGIEDITVDHLPLDLAVERLDKAIFLGRSNMGKLLFDSHSFKGLTQVMSNELAAVVVAQDNPFYLVALSQLADQGDYLWVPHAVMQGIGQNLAGIDIHQGEQISLFSIGMDIDVFDIHGQVLQRTIGLDLPELDKISLAGRSDRSAIDQVAFFH